jgi:hypothetical protein
MICSHKKTLRNLEKQKNDLQNYNTAENLPLLAKFILYCKEFLIRLSCGFIIGFIHSKFFANSSKYLTVKFAKFTHELSILILNSRKSKL